MRFSVIADTLYWQYLNKLIFFEPPVSKFTFGVVSNLISPLPDPRISLHVTAGRKQLPATSTRII